MVVSPSERKNMKEPVPQNAAEDKKNSQTADPAEKANEAKVTTNSARRPSEGNSEAKTEGSCDKDQVKNLWVSGLGARTKAADLKSLFAKYDKVVNVKIVASTKPQNVQYFGYVVMASSEGANVALTNLNNTEFHGKVISIQKTTADPFVASPSTPSKKMETSKSHASGTVKSDKQVNASDKKEKISDNSEKTASEKNDKLTNEAAAVVKSSAEKEKEQKTDPSVEGEVNKMDVQVEEESKLDEKEIEKSVDMKEVSDESKEAEVKTGETPVDVATTEKKETEEPKKTEDAEGKDKKRLPRNRSREHSRERRRPRRSRSRDRRGGPRFRGRDYRRSFPSRRFPPGRPFPDRFRDIPDRFRDRRRDEYRRRDEPYRRRSRSLERRESRRLERELDNLRMEKEQLEYERLKLEREKQQVEREKLEREKAELRRQAELEGLDDISVLKRRYDGGNDFWGESKRMADHGDIGSFGSFSDFHGAGSFHGQERFDERRDNPPPFSGGGRSMEGPDRRGRDRGSWKGGRSRGRGSHGPTPWKNAPQEPDSSSGHWGRMPESSEQWMGNASHGPRGGMHNSGNAPPGAFPNRRGGFAGDRFGNPMGRRF